VQVCVFTCVICFKKKDSLFIHAYCLLAAPYIDHTKSIRVVFIYTEKVQICVGLSRMADKILKCSFLYDDELLILVLRKVP
jgi:hypothetical protein